MFAISVVRLILSFEWFFVFPGPKLKDTSLLLILVARPVNARVGKDSEIHLTS
ncbi:hypothetical protein M758_1G161000 [Ceratodon purpureus]|nr:hypothetical protein M758_1G161000 [Ceratodon purpureus]